MLNCTIWYIYYIITFIEFGSKDKVYWKSLGNEHYVSNSSVIWTTKWLEFVVFWRQQYVYQYVHIYCTTMSQSLQILEKLFWGSVVQFTLHWVSLETLESISNDLYASSELLSCSVMPLKSIFNCDNISASWQLYLFWHCTTTCNDIDCLIPWWCLKQNMDRLICQSWANLRLIHWSSSWAWYCGAIYSI